MKQEMPGWVIPLIVVAAVLVIGGVVFRALTANTEPPVDMKKATSAPAYATQGGSYGAASAAQGQ